MCSTSISRDHTEAAPPAAAPPPVCEPRHGATPIHPADEDVLDGEPGNAALNRGDLPAVQTFYGRKVRRVLSL